MATYKAEHLKEMIRSVVREEIRREVSGVVSEILADKFLKQIAESAVSSRPRGVSMNFPVQGDEFNDEHVPEALDNNILAPGQPNPRFQKSPKSKAVVQFKEDKQRNEMLSLFFEGTQPLNEKEARSEEGVPLEAITEATDSEGPAKWAELFKDAEKLAENKRPIQRDPAAEEERLKRLRAQLDVKAG